MTDISSVIKFYVRRNSRLRERGEPVHSIRGFFSRYDSNDDVLKMLRVDGVTDALYYDMDSREVYLPRGVARRFRKGEMDYDTRCSRVHQREHEHDNRRPRGAGR